MVMVQRGHDQLKDMLQWVGGEVSKSQHQPSDSNWSGIHMLVGSILTLIINFSHLEGISVSAKQLKDIVVCISIDGETGPYPKAALGCLFLPDRAFPPLLTTD